MTGKIILNSYVDKTPPFSFLANQKTSPPSSPLWEEHAPSNLRPSDTQEVGFIENTQNFFSFLNEVREVGLSRAIYGKPFSKVVGDFFKELFHDIGVFLLANADLFFLAPAILLMFLTFLIGRNKYTRWIIPLWFIYFITTFFHKMIA